jgi:cell division protein FtsQ
MKLFHGKSSDRRYMGEQRRFQKFSGNVAHTRAIFSEILSGFFYVSLLIITLICMLWFFRQVNDSKKFVVHEVVFVSPLIHVDSNKLRKISLPFIGGSFFKTNIFELKKRLSHLPWVSQVTVLRIWPNGLSVCIKEQEAVAQLSEDSLLNKNLEIFTVPQESVPAYLPKFKGPAGQLQVMWQNYKAIERILRPIGLHVVYLEVSERQSWRLKLNNGLTLIIGRAEGLDHLSRFVGVYRQIVASHNLGSIDYIDLRYSNGMALSPPQPPNAPSELGLVNSNKVLH